jgi:hypothetical protein
VNSLPKVSWGIYQIRWSPDQFEKELNQLFISEIGCADDSRKPLWIKDFLDRVSIDRRIAAFIYYDYYPKGRGFPNWRLDSDGITLQIFRKWANDQNVVLDLNR